MTSAFQVHTYRQTEPRYDAEVWDGTNGASLFELVKRVHWSRVDELTWAVGDEDAFVAVAPYLRVVVPLGDAYVVGPYWGGEPWGQDGMGQCPAEVMVPALFANRFTLDE